MQHTCFHCRYNRNTAVLKIRVSRNTHLSKTHYIRAKSGHLIWVSFTTHHYRATQPHSPDKVHQLEVSCNTHHFSASCFGNFEVHWLEWTDIRLSPKKQFVLALIKIIIYIEPYYTSFTAQKTLNIVKLHHREWAVPHHTLECPYSFAAVVHCWEWALAYLTLVLFI